MKTLARGGATASATGITVGYKYAADVRAMRLALSARPLHVPTDLAAFRGDAEQIVERQRGQTAAVVRGLKAKFESPVFGKVRVWDLIEKLAQCIDPTDLGLYCASQLVHVQQILAAMERNRVADRDLVLTALIHDLGKVLLLRDEVPENIVCSARRLGEYEPGVGLDRIVYQFGHAEMIYTRMKDHVPDHVAWVARYHNIDLRDAAPYMDARDRAYAEQYMRPFRLYDGGFKSPYFRPQIHIQKYRDFVEECFPQPILF